MSAIHNNTNICVFGKTQAPFLTQGQGETYELICSPNGIPIVKKDVCDLIRNSMSMSITTKVDGQFSLLKRIKLLTINSQDAADIFSSATAAVSEPIVSAEIDDVSNKQFGWIFLQRYDCRSNLAYVTINPNGSLTVNPVHPQNFKVNNSMKKQIRTGKIVFSDNNKNENENEKMCLIECNHPILVGMPGIKKINDPILSRLEIDENNTEIVFGNDNEVIFYPNCSIRKLDLLQINEDGTMSLRQDVPLDETISQIYSIKPPTKYISVEDISNKIQGGKYVETHNLRKNVTTIIRHGESTVNFPDIQMPGKNSTDEECSQWMMKIVEQAIKYSGNESRPREGIVLYFYNENHKISFVKINRGLMNVYLKMQQCKELNDHKQLFVN